MYMTGQQTCFIALALALGIAATAALAHTGATGIVKERMDAMSELEDRMKAIVAMLKGKAPFDAAAVKAAAEVMAGHAARMPNQFPEGSLKHPSEALPAIWTDWTAFANLAEDMKSRAHALEAAAGTATDASGISSEFVAVGATCKSCHDKFRKPK